MRPWDGFNLPENYLKPIGGDRRTQFLLELMKLYTDTNGNILEIGCNVGRNLNYLFLAGFDKLTGIEISEDAVALMEKTYPEMAKSAKIINTPVEDVIGTFKENEFDVVFTMAVLEHIHPDSKFIFSEMVRITRRNLITIEDEKGISWRHFPHNYKKIFESLGMKQVYQYNCREVDGLGSNFWARVFTEYDRE
jgi:SAM-dependent methyltransferase